MRSVVVALALLGLSAAITDVAAAPAKEGEARARTRIRVYPMRDMVRECRAWLAQEVWPNGNTYIVPRQHCWWTPKR